MKEKIHEHTQQLRLRDNSIIFDLWRSKNGTSSQDITLIHTPKERSDLVLQTSICYYSQVNICATSLCRGVYFSFFPNVNISS